MRNCLIVLQPRRIEPCLRSLRGLPVDQAWFEAFTERQLVRPLNRFIADTGYDNYLVVSDDVIVSTDAFALVVELLRDHEAATGYCRLSQDSPLVNVVRSPLQLRDGAVPTLDDYDFYRLSEVRRLDRPVFPTWFGGWALTGLRRQLWLDFPFAVNRVTGMQSDFETFFRLNRAIVAHRDAYVEHLKPHVDGPCTANRIVGRVPPRIVFRKANAR